MKKKISTLSLFFALTGLSITAHGKENVSYSLMAKAFAPNAGGQEAYALRRASPDHEISVFVNTYLLAGDYPLVGGSYGWRFELCKKNCYLQSYTNIGLGLSTAGPLAEILWGVIPFWIFRIDIAAHFILIPNRIVTWSYPLWLGLSIPI